MDVHYKGYTGKIFFSPEAGTFYGEISNVEDFIVFQASSPQGAIEAMQEAIDCHYLKNLTLTKETI